MTRLVGVPDAGQTDLVTGLVPYKFRKRPLAAVSLLPLYRKTRVEVDYFIGGGAGPACMKDLVVTDGLLKSEGSLALDLPLQPKTRLQSCS